TTSSRFAAALTSVSPPTPRRSPEGPPTDRLASCSTPAAAFAAELCAVWAAAATVPAVPGRLRKAWPGAAVPPGVTPTVAGVTRVEVTRAATLRLLVSSEKAVWNPPPGDGIGKLRTTGGRVGPRARGK